MNNNNTSRLFWIGLIVGILAMFFWYHPQYQGKSAQDWFNSYTSEQSKADGLQSQVDSLKQSLQLANNTQIQKDQQKSALQTCLDVAETAYKTDWANNCKYFGLDGTGSTCELPEYYTNTLNDREQQNKDNCFKQYPQN